MQLHMVATSATKSCSRSIANRRYFKGRRPGNRCPSRQHARPAGDAHALENSNVDTMVHTAADRRPGAGNANRPATNIISGTIISRAARLKKLRRVVYVSTSASPNPQDYRHVVNELHPIGGTLYETTKVCSEHCSTLRQHVQPRLIIIPPAASSAAASYVGGSRRHGMRDWRCDDRAIRSQSTPRPTAQLNMSTANVGSRSARVPAAKSSTHLHAGPARSMTPSNWPKCA